MSEMNAGFPCNAVEMAKYLCRQKLSEGGKAADATAGNGNDTEFLASIVKDSGRIYAFDIQKKAIENTKRRLEGKEDLPEVVYINEGHENMKKHVKENLDVVIFNLGYLPRGDHSITTRADTTLEGIGQSLELLNKYGIVVVVIYHGHDEGKREKSAVEEYVNNLDQKKYNAMKFSFINQINDAPYVVAIEKMINS